VKKPKLSTNLQVETVPIADLAPHPRNYRAHPDAQIEHLQASLRDYGFARNIVVSSDNVILAGHGIVEAAKRNGYTEVPVNRLGIAGDDPKAQKFLVLENEVWRQSDDNDRMLTELLKDINDDLGLEGTGFDESMLANLLFVTRPESEIRDFDAAAEWVGMPDLGNEAREKGVSLVVWFDGEDERQQFMELNELKNTTKHASGRGALSARWPNRDNERGTYTFKDDGSGE
jgi:hypothetical protein